MSEPLPNNSLVTKGTGVVYVYEHTHQCQIGRLASDLHFGDETAKVCFHTGCTAATCSTSQLYRINNADLIEHWDECGHHRFHALCPEFDSDVCLATCPEKAVY